MTEYVVKIAFWLRAFDSVTIEATSDAEAVEKAKVAATAAMESTALPGTHRHRRATGRRHRLHRPDRAGRP